MTIVVALGDPDDGSMDLRWTKESVPLKSIVHRVSLLADAPGLVEVMVAKGVEICKWTDKPLPALCRLNCLMYSSDTNSHLNFERYFHRTKREILSTLKGLRNITARTQIQRPKRQLREIFRIQCLLTRPIGSLQNQSKRGDLA